ncbi:putative deoxyribonuclease tatdn3 [Dissophora globulifera]|uniref:Deoxyribonuclease tatdn3 n=1 Tax=Dissophora globulifera TaxID=979702 RepID=A0A9P6R479_9FUNG|nr:putative deoxyribonuclease tatdn3 [Dissophora globulifera]
MIDIHAHIYPPTIPAGSIPPLLQRAKAAGVTSILSVSENLVDARHILRLAIQHTNFLFPCAGMHPAQPVRDPDGATVGYRSVVESDLEGFFEFMEENVGLDFTLPVLDSLHNACPPRAAAAAAAAATTGGASRDPSPPTTMTHDDIKTEQRKVFARQVRFAIQQDLPLNVHSRSAGHHAITLLEELGAKKVVLHAFDGQLKYVRKGLALGYYFSIPTSVVRTPQQQALAQEVPLELMLLESDTPCLGPERGVSNVPSNLSFAAHEIARIKNVDLETVPETMSRLYAKGRVLGFKRAKRNQRPDISLIQIEGVKTAADTDFYLGKRIAFVYRAKREVNGSKIRCIWGRITRTHGGSGAVKARFRNNLPAKSFGASVRIMMYPSRV